MVQIQRILVLRGTVHLVQHEQHGRHAWHVRRHHSDCEGDCRGLLCCSCGYCESPHRPCVHLAVQAFSSSTSSIAGTGIDPEGIDNNPAYYGQCGTFGFRELSRRVSCLSPR